MRAGAGASSSPPDRLSSSPPQCLSSPPHRRSSPPSHIVSPRVDGRQGESLVPPYTRGSVSLSLSPSAIDSTNASCASAATSAHGYINGANGHFTGIGAAGDSGVGSPCSLTAPHPIPPAAGRTSQHPSPPGAGAGADGGGRGRGGGKAVQVETS